MLPSLQTPEFTTTVPSSGKEVKFRPFLVKEEKILYFALESGETGDIVSAIQKIFTNCILSDFKVDDMAYFDFEYLFLMLRAKSVGESIELKLRHDVEDCGQVNDISINIEDIKVVTVPNHTDKIMLNDDIGVKMKYPTIENLSLVQQDQNTFDIIRDSIEYVYDQETVYDDFTKDEADNFLESLSKSQFELISEFFATMPKLRHEVKYKCKKCKKTETVLLEGLQSFFT
jgi:hypothetical protein